MTTLVALKFDTPEGAGKLRELLLDLQKQKLVQIGDAAVITWPNGSKRPHTQELVSLTGAGAINGAFWGMLFGLIFFMPLLGAAIGALSGGLSASMIDIGVDDTFVKSMREKVTEGTSSLVLLVGDITQDKVFDAVREQGIAFEVISSNLSNEQEAKLRDTFAA